MGIFKKRAKDDSAEDLETLDTPDEAEDETDEAEDVVAVSEDAGDDDSAEDYSADVVAAIDRSSGPFDISEVDDDADRVDFGSLQFVVQPDLQLQVDADEESQRYTGVTAVSDGSACQVQVFAAPKTRGVWREIRGEIADNLIASGGSTDVVDG